MESHRAPGTLSHIHGTLCVNEVLRPPSLGLVLLSYQAVQSPRLPFPWLELSFQQLNVFVLFSNHNVPD